uniref:Dehydrogenase n=1 Tax=Discosia rubi TaxID=2502037 RepID=A0A6M6HZ29_9PEZI|nr:dehydrogenase [Discosia rubi]
MSDPNTITAYESPGGPPPGLSLYPKLRWSKSHPPIDPKVSFAGKTVLVTGANTGLGFQSAVKFAALGADKLILGVRSLDKGEDAKARIIDLTGRDGDVIVVLPVDLGEFESVRAFVNAVKRTTPKLDVALLNAGLGNPTYETSSAGWEMALQVNVLSTALMAILLLPILRASATREATPHLTFVNSHGHMMVQKDWYEGAGSLLKAANEEKDWDTNKSYSLVKLLGIAVMQAIARATVISYAGSQPQVIVNAVCPDLCRTDLGRKWGFISKIGMVIFYALFARTAEEGARSLVSATALGLESHGRFWHHDILYP